MTQPSFRRTAFMAKAVPLGGAGLGLLLAACGTPPPTPIAPAVGSQYAPFSGCSPDTVTPHIVTTRAADLPQTIYERAKEWEVRVTFAIDEHGVPVDVRGTTASSDADANDLAGIAADALTGYRFCPLPSSTALTRWKASIRFRPVRRPDGVADTFIQMFVPAFTRGDVEAHRFGTVRVAATFAEDGRPSSVRLVAGSGDAALDRKSLEAMASWQLVSRPGTVRPRPFVFEQPYTYQIH